jgi:hypothetical protein
VLPGPVVLKTQAEEGDGWRLWNGEDPPHLRRKHACIQDSCQVKNLTVDKSPLHSLITKKGEWNAHSCDIAMADVTSQRLPRDEKEKPLTAQ